MIFFKLKLTNSESKIFELNHPLWGQRYSFILNRPKRNVFHACQFSFSCPSEIGCWIHSHRSVWIEHDSNGSSHGSWWEISGELNSNSTGMSVGVNDLSPLNSKSCVVYGVLYLVNVGDPLTKIESGSTNVSAVLNFNQSLTFLLSGLSSSESSEDTLLVKSYWLSFVVDLL